MFESLFIIKINTSFNMEGKSQTMHLSAFRKNKNKILRGHSSSGQYGTIQSEQNQGRQKKYIYIFIWPSLQNGLSEPIKFLFHFSFLGYSKEVFLPRQNYKIFVWWGRGEHRIHQWCQPINSVDFVLKRVELIN